MRWTNTVHLFCYHALKERATSMLDTTTQIKLMVLFMLEGVDYPVATSTVYDFFLGKEYTGYFMLNELINCLTTDEFIETSKTHGTTFLTITDKGRETMQMLQEHVYRGIKEEISDFMTQNTLDSVNRAAVFTNYFRVGVGDYVAEVVAREKYCDLISIKLNVPTEESAQLACDNWRDASADIYSYVTKRLLEAKEKGGAQDG